MKSLQEKLIVKDLKPFKNPNKIFFVLGKGLKV